MSLKRKTLLPEEERIKQIAKSNENWANKKARKPAYKYNPYWYEKFINRPTKQA